MLHTCACLSHAQRGQGHAQAGKLRCCGKATWQASCARYTRSDITKHVFTFVAWQFICHVEVETQRTSPTLGTEPNARILVVREYKTGRSVASPVYLGKDPLRLARPNARRKANSDVVFRRGVA